MGMGATLHLRDFTAVLTRPKALAYGLTIQVILVPLAQFALTSVTFPGGDIATILVFIAGLATFSWIAPRLFGLSSPDTTAINIEVTFRNGNLGLWIRASLFPAVVGVHDPIGDIVLFTVLLYGGLAFPFAAAQVYLHGRRNEALDVDVRKPAV